MPGNHGGRRRRVLASEELSLPRLSRDWQDSAACRGMESSLFFAPDGETRRPQRRRVQRAKAVCRACPVRAVCLDEALRVREPYGIWGGYTEEERKDLRLPARLAVSSAR